MGRFIAKLPKIERIKIIYDISNQLGFSIRLLSRTMGIGQRVVEKLVKNDKRHVPLTCSFQELYIPE